MKQKLYISGVITTLVIFTGVIFKVNHFPGAGILLTLGLTTLVVFFIPSALINHYKSHEPRQNFWLHAVTGLTCFVVFTAMLFKIQHWPYAGAALFIALPFPYIVFLPVFLHASKNRNFNIYNVVIVLSLLAFNSVFSALLALNVSKARIDDSYNLSQNYNNLQKVMDLIPHNIPPSEVDMKIDEVLNIVNEYRDMILKSEGITIEEWHTKPENLLRPDSRLVGAQVLLAKEGAPVGSRLENGLKSLIAEMGKTKGYEDLSKAAPSIFNLNETNDLYWGEMIFKDNNLSWALTYLDALAANLNLIRASVPLNN